jgi:hypothetical protein
LEAPAVTIVIPAGQSLIRFFALHTGRVHFSGATVIVVPFLLAAGCPL